MKSKIIFFSKKSFDHSFWHQKAMYDVPGARGLVLLYYFTWKMLQALYKHLLK